MIDTSGGTIFPVDKIGDLKRLDTPGNLQVAEQLGDRLKQDVRAALFDRELPDPGGAVKSATEIIERIRQASQNIGTPFSRIMSEMIIPITQRTLNIMERKFIIDQPLKINGRAVKIMATSPLAKQQSLNDLDSVVNWITLGQQLGPEVMFGGIKMEDVLEFAGEKLGVPQELIRDETERKDLSEAVAGIIAQTQLGGVGAAPQEPAAV